MPLTNNQMQNLIADQMTIVVNDKTLSTTQRTRQMTHLNNSFVRSSHVMLRAMRLASTVLNRKQELTLPKVVVDLQLRLPVLKQ